MKILLVRLLLLGKVQNFVLSGCMISQRNSVNIKILPYDKYLDSSEFERSQSVTDHKAIFTGVLRYFIEIFLQQPLFLN